MLDSWSYPICVFLINDPPLILLVNIYADDTKVYESSSQNLDFQGITPDFLPDLSLTTQ